MDETSDNRNATMPPFQWSRGIAGFTTGWEKLFDGKARFAIFTHQEWVRCVRDHDRRGRWKNCLRYVSERYGYSQD